MSVLIRGVEMPTDHPLWIVVHADGTVEANEVSQSRPVGWQTLLNAAFPVPEHGRLIDADARVNVQLYNDEFEDYQTVNMSIDDLLDSSWIELEDDPTVIPTEEVYGKYTDTAGKMHWTGTRSGEHIFPAEPCNNLSMPCKEDEA